MMAREEMDIEEEDGCYLSKYFDSDSSECLLSGINYGNILQ
jgi:hypothetical protein